MHVFVSNRGHWTEKLDLPHADWAVDISSTRAALVVEPLDW